MLKRISDMISAERYQAPALPPAPTIPTLREVSPAYAEADDRLQDILALGCRCESERLALIQTDTDGGSHAANDVPSPRVAELLGRSAGSGWASSSHSRIDNDCVRT